MARRLPWPVAMVPLGTANLVARDAVIPLGADVEPHVRTILEGVPWEVDLLQTDRGRALAVVGAGLDAAVVRAVADVRRGGVGGYGKWLVPIARTFVQNTLCYGGLFTLSRDARMDDGVLDVVVLSDAGRRDHFRMLFRAYANRLHHDHRVTILRGHAVSVTADRPTDVQADGDPAGATPLRAHVLPRALTLLRPPPP